MNILRVIIILSIGLLQACSLGSDPAIQSMLKVFNSDDSAGFNPNYRYLRVVVNDRVAFLVLGAIDHDAHGPVEVWASGEGAAFRLQNGRFVGAVGLPVEWRNVLMPELPSWSSLAHDEHPVLWTRIRDVMPGYRFGVKDSLVLRHAKIPNHSEIKVLNPAELTWFEERSSSSDSPFARYAVDFHRGKELVVYGEQCLSETLCFSWQRWPVSLNLAPDEK